MTDTRIQTLAKRHRQTGLVEDLKAVVVARHRSDLLSDNETIFVTAAAYCRDTWATSLVGCGRCGGVRAGESGLRTAVCFNCWPKKTSAGGDVRVIHRFGMAWTTGLLGLVLAPVCPTGTVSVKDEDDLQLEIVSVAALGAAESAADDFEVRHGVNCQDCRYLERTCGEGLAPRRAIEAARECLADPAADRTHWANLADMTVCRQREWVPHPNDADSLPGWVDTIRTISERRYCKDAWQGASEAVIDWAMDKLAAKA